MGTRRGAFYDTPFAARWADYDLYVGQANRSDLFDQMRPDAVRVRHGRCQHFGPSDQTGNSYFPWNAFLAFDAAEVAAGRASLLVTASGRPVFFTQSLRPDAQGIPSAPWSAWYRAVNCGDPRFVAWWLAHYARPIMHAGAGNWVGIDNGTWHYSAYCALDPAGAVVPSARWDAPLPQDDRSYLGMVEAFFATLAQIAPDVRTLVNRGTMDLWDAYPAVYAQVAGTIGEELSYPYKNGSPYLRQLLYHLTVADLWASGAGKSLVLRWPYLPPPTDPTFAGELRRSYVHFLLLANETSYYNPAHGGVELDPALWAPMAAALGDPQGVATIGANVGLYEGYRSYFRQTARGAVCLNWTGAPIALSLPPDRLWVGRGGRLVGALVVGDMDGDYALAIPPGTYTDSRRILAADGSVVAAQDGPLTVPAWSAGV